MRETVWVQLQGKFDLNGPITSLNHASGAGKRRYTEVLAAVPVDQLTLSGSARRPQPAHAARPPGSAAVTRTTVE